MQFAFGLVTGIALLSSVGFIVLLTKVNGSGSAKVTTTTTAAANTNTTPVAAAPQPTGPVILPEITKADHVRGDFDAPVTIVEFSDIQCPYCRQFHPTMQRILSEYPGKVRWVWKHYPLESIHPNARPAALASECAAEQNKFWEFVDTAIENQQVLSTDFFVQTAESLKLNKKKFEDCLNSQKFASEIDQDITQASAAQVTGTPSSFVNGQEVAGALPYEQVKPMVEAALASVR